MSGLLMYWISTSLIAIILVWSAYTYCFSDAAITGFRELGFPDFFRHQLIILKLIAVPVLLLPAISIPVKEWAYAGVALFFLTALIAHISHEDSFGFAGLLLLFLALLFTSNVLMRRVLGT